MNPNNPRPLAGFFVYRHLGLAVRNIGRDEMVINQFDNSLLLCSFLPE